ncbi:DUF177 domain-containing protein [Clostridiaceae bacterium OttesenSCG-928-D20]|nr:DUF177 domain-containing protein [Clostridiaceae bacterium OttesenSCG-928-D20]
MILDLRPIIELSGSKKSFDFSAELDFSSFPSIISAAAPTRVFGEVENKAGLILLTGAIEMSLLCSCDRCLREYSYSLKIPFELTLAKELQDEENPDIILIEGDEIDLSELSDEIFLLEMENKFLCSEDCKGLCESCGANLNEGECSCKKEIDPRLKALESLLERDE